MRNASTESRAATTLESVSLLPRVSIAIDAQLRGRLVRRYKRFFADIETQDGQRLTVHCPDPGSMRGCAIPGAAVRCSESDNPKRKLRHTLEMIRIGRIWVGVNTLRANRLVKRSLELGAIPALRDYRRVRPEVKVADGTRLDFELDEHPGRLEKAYVEVKSVTLARGRLALFPDSVTERGRRHVEALATLRRGGARAVLLFVVQRGDSDAVSPADDIDPAYGRALRRAARAGVEVMAVQARITARAMRLERVLPVLL